MRSRLLESMGWKIVVNQVTGQLYIYRADHPGEMTLDVTENGYEFNAYADADTFVTGTFASFEALTSKEPA